MPVLEGARSPEKRRDRVRLYALDPVSDGLLSGLPIEPEHLHETRAFAKVLVRDRNAYDINRRRGGLFGRRIGKDEADALLARLVAGLAEGGAL